MNSNEALFTPWPRLIDSEPLMIWRGSHCRMSFLHSSASFVKSNIQWTSIYLRKCWRRGRNGEASENLSGTVFDEARLAYSPSLADRESRNKHWGWYPRQGSVPCIPTARQHKQWTRPASPRFTHSATAMRVWGIIIADIIVNMVKWNRLLYIVQRLPIIWVCQINHSGQLEVEVNWCREPQENG